MAKFNESAFEAALELAAATLEGEAEVSVDRAGAAAVMEYFTGLYEGMSAILGGEEDDEAEAEDAEQAPEEAEAEEAPLSGGSFALKRSTAGFKFDLRAANNEIVAYSEVYSNRAACLKGVESLRGSAGYGVWDTTEESGQPVKNPRFEVFKDKAGEYRFRVRSRNGRIVAASEGYKKKDSCLKGIASVKKNAARAALVEK